MADGGSNTTIQAPTTSPQQAALESSQAQLLNEQNNILQNQQTEQQQLMPLFFQQAGVQPTYANGTTTPSPAGPPISAPTLTAANISQYQNGGINGAVSPDATNFAGLIAQAGGNTSGGFSAAETTPAEYSYLSTLNSAGFPTADASGASGTYAQPSPNNQITGFTQDPNSIQATDQALLEGVLQNQNAATAEQTALQPQENQILSGEATLTNQEVQQASQALAGTLPVNPAVTQQMTLTGQQLNDQLTASLGPDYATSSPGIAALKSWQEAQAAITFGANTGQLTLDQQLAQAGQSQYMAGTGQSAGIGLSAAGYGSTANAGLSSVFGPTAMTLGQMSNLTGQYGQAQQPYQFQQGLSLNAAIQQAMLSQAQSATQSNLFGGIGGSALGAAGAIGAGFAFGA